MNKLEGVRNDPSLFVRVHARMACDADKWKYIKATVVYRNLRRNTTVQYLMDSWDAHGGWD